VEVLTSEVLSHLWGYEMKVRRCQIRTVWWMWKNFSAPGVQEIYGRSSTVRPTIVMQKKNPESFGQQSWSHLRWWIYVLTEPMLANSMQESFQREWTKEPYSLNCPRICPCLKIWTIMVHRTSNFEFKNTLLLYQIYPWLRVDCNMLLQFQFTGL
jgi:hypothetical protein